MESLPVGLVHRLFAALGRIGRDGFLVMLGAIWTLDGLLQLQPYMYEKGSNGLFGPVALETMGRPNALNDFLAFMIRHMVAHEAISNSAIVLVQVAIGVLLILSSIKRRYDIARLTLVVSIAWAFMVWVVGEGIGGMIMPQASMLTGAPGAAIIYVLAGLYLWPPKDLLKYYVSVDSGEETSDSSKELSDGTNWDNSDQRNDGGQVSQLMDKKAAYPTYPLDNNEKGAVAAHGLLGSTASYIAWAILWCGSALLELQYGNFAPHSIPTQIRYEAKGEPHWLSFLDLHIASILHGEGTVVAGTLLVVEFAVGWLILRPATRKIALISGMVLSTAFWVVGQNFGTIFSGQATDLNSGPLLVLLALLLWPRNIRQAKRHSISSVRDDAASSSGNSGSVQNDAASSSGDSDSGQRDVSLSSGNTGSDHNRDDSGLIRV